MCWLCVAEKPITIAAAGLKRGQVMEPEPVAGFEMEKESLRMALCFLQRARYTRDGSHQGFGVCWSAFLGENQVVQ